MTYQRQSDIPKKRSEQEIRIESMLYELELPYRTNQVFCRTCLCIAPNHNGYQYPNHCTVCRMPFDGPKQYTLPDYVILEKGILYVNGGVHDKNKNVKKDREQIAAVEDAGYSVFVIKNDEIDNMTNATLKLYLLGLCQAVKVPSLHSRVYHGEKEYSCLR